MPFEHLYAYLAILGENIGVEIGYLAGCSYVPTLTGWDPSAWKSNRWLHVPIFWFSFIKLGIFYKFL